MRTGRPSSSCSRSGTSGLRALQALTCRDDHYARSTPAPQFRVVPRRARFRFRHHLESSAECLRVLSSAQLRDVNDRTWGMLNFVILLCLLLRAAAGLEQASSAVRGPHVALLALAPWSPPLECNCAGSAQQRCAEASAPWPPPPWRHHCSWACLPLNGPNHIAPLQDGNSSFVYNGFMASLSTSPQPFSGTYGHYHALTAGGRLVRGCHAPGQRQPAAGSLALKHGSLPASAWRTGPPGCTLLCHQAWRCCASPKPHHVHSVPHPPPPPVALPAAQTTCRRCGPPTRT